MNKTRLAFFSDLHIRHKKIQSQTDFGGPSKWIPRKASDSLNDIGPDYIFGLGDLTATGHREDWLGYKKWLEGLKPPVFDILGNHDRDYTVFHNYNYGKEYFSILKRTSATKAVKIGNLIFILVSEEHDPEGNKKVLTSTIPLRTFRFIEEILQKYSQDNNVFILSHTLLRGTTALSNDWSFNDIKEWKIISRRFFDLFEKYPVVAHLTGHTHMDYRYKARLKTIEEEKYKRKIGKFVNGKNYERLPDTYFLNLPCVDTAHGWLGSNFALLRKLGTMTAKARRSPFRWLYIHLEEKGPRIFDWLYKLKINNLIGRPAVYYFDVFPKEKKIEIITRWLEKNKDVEKYKINLNCPVEISDPEAEVMASSLSLQTKKNLEIVRDNWFEVSSGKRGEGVFSKSFSCKKEVKGVKIISENLKNYDVLWRGSRDSGNNWTKKWIKSPGKLGKINAVKMKMSFKTGNKKAKIKDILVKTKS